MHWFKKGTMTYDRSWIIILIGLFFGFGNQTWNLNVDLNIKMVEKELKNVKNDKMNWDVKNFG